MYIEEPHPRGFKKFILFLRFVKKKDGDFWEAS